MEKTHYKETKDFTFKAVCKKTGKEFSNYSNKNNELVEYIEKLYPEEKILSKYDRCMYRTKNGIFWYENFFDIIKIPREKTIKKSKVTILSDYEKKEIVDLYTSKKIDSKTKLAKMFHVGIDKINDTLKENGIEDVILTKEGNYIYEKYKEDELYTYKAVCKKTGEEFSDYVNVHGYLWKHIKNIYPNEERPTLYAAKKEYNLTGMYWFEKYFDIVKIPKPKKETKKCPYCDWETIDIENKSGWFEQHLRNEHNKTVESYLVDFPEYKSYFPVLIKKRKRKKDFENEENYVVCKVCDKKYKQLQSHLENVHHITTTEYKEKYNTNSIMSESKLKEFSENSLKANLVVSKNRFISKPEKEIQEFLTQNNVKFESNRQILIGRELDILIEDKKIAIEFDGLKWHTEWFGKKDKNYHIDKTERCNKKGYHLIHIFEDEFVNSKELVYSKLKHILGIEENLPKIPARKCVIKEISKTDETNFLNDFHIQGVGQSTFSFGAFYNEKLIAVMTFKELIKGSDDYDLTRFASNINYICQGVGGKLISHFIKNFKPKSIISFADRRWTDINKNVYTKMGFILVEISKPEYRYYNEKVDKYKRFHKFGFRKNILMKKYGEEYNLNLNMTETEMVKILGYDRIWDCGLLKYKMVF